jgi:hypothetical protein
MMDTPTCINFVEEIYLDYAIYRVVTLSPDSPAQREGVHYYKRNYSVTENSSVEWTAEPVEVIREVQYKPVVTTNEGGTQRMDRKDKIAKLIASGIFSADDTAMLEAMDVAVFEKIQIPEPKVVETKVVEKPEVTVNEALSVLSQNKVDNSAIFGLLPEAAQMVLTEAISLYETNKQSLIEAIKANPLNTFTEDELKLKTPAELTKIAAFAKTGAKNPVDFSILGIRTPVPTPAPKEYEDEFLTVSTFADFLPEKK